MLEKILSNGIVDLVYRFLLWALFSIFLRAVALHTDSAGGVYIAAAIARSSNGVYWNVLLCIGLLLMILSVVAKDVLVSFSKGKWCNEFFEQLAFIVGKISSDLMLSGYGAASFLIGWGVFALVEGCGSHQSISFGGLAFFALFMTLTAAIGFMSLVARSKPDSKYISWWFNKAPDKWRLLCYAVVFPANVAILWFYPATKI